MQLYTASVIIPTFNRINELKLTLDSLCTQTCTFSFEVIVCDDGSSEDVASLLALYKCKLNISYLYQEDRGFRAAAARNMGIRNSSGEICIFIDNGIILHSKAIEEHILTHKASNLPSVVIGYVYGFDIDIEKAESLTYIIENNGSNFDQSIEIAEKERMFDIREKFYTILGSELHEWPAPFLICWSNNISVPKKTILDIGMFDEYFTSWGGEDIDLGLSLQESGVKFILNRNAKSVHYPHKKGHQWDSNPEIEIEKLQAKKEYMLKKHPIRAMQLWMDVYSTVKLNQALMNE